MVIMAGLNVSGDNRSSSEVFCNLTEGYSFILQTVLGILAFSTLIREWTAFETSDKSGVAIVACCGLSIILVKPCTS